MNVPLSCTVNDQPVRRDVPGDCTLLSFLRDHLGLTGTKGACLEGECGSCTVLLDEQPVCGCLVLAAQVQGRRVTTVEGLLQGSNLSNVQQAFIESGAAQCGYCTPGLIMSATALLAEQADPTDGEVREALEGNLCRCTGYASVMEAARIAAESNARGG